jgi:uncharacterized protein (TIGR03435 family)
MPNSDAAGKSQVVCRAGGLMLVTVVTVSLVAQTFDIVSIKPNTSGENRTSMQPEPGRFVAINTPARMLLRVAFGGNSPNGLIPDFEIVGGPNWLGSDRFDIRAQGDVALSPERMDTAVLAMLEDRFRLQTHREVRELPVYALVIAKSGSKLKSMEAPSLASQEASTPSPPPPPGPGGLMPASFKPSPGHLFAGPGAIIASAVPMKQLIDRLTSQLERPVIDKTGLTGFFDIRLEFSPEGSAQSGINPAPTPAPSPPFGDSAVPSIFTAVQEQLGLRLDSTRAPVEVVVVDSIRRPTEN